MVERPTADPLDGPVSVRRFADWLGVAHKTVMRRIDAGALPTSSQRVNGVWMILDCSLAVSEWESFTRPWIGSSADDPATPVPSPMAEMMLRERRARVEVLELGLARSRGELVLLSEVEMRWTAHVLRARTRLLALPTAARARLPNLTVKDLAVLDALIREALAELASAPDDNKGAS